MFGTKGEHAKISEELALRVTEILEEARKNNFDKKLTYKELEEIMKIDDTYIYKMFKGKQSITLERFFQLCTILELDPNKVIKSATKKGA